MSRKQVMRIINTLMMLTLILVLASLAFVCVYIAACLAMGN